MNKQLLFFLCSIILFNACIEVKNKRGKPIDLNDPALVVTEADSSYLQNKVRDISVQKVSAVKEVSQIVHAIDSNKKEKELIEQPESLINGIKLKGENYSIVLDAPITESAQRFIFTTGEVSENINGSIVGLENAKIMQRFNTSLAVSINGKEKQLSKFGAINTEWKTLPLVKNNFVSLSFADALFSEIKTNQLKQIFNEELKSEKLNKQQKIEMKKVADEIASVQESPFVIKKNFIELQVSGTIKGKKVAKTFKIGK
jgi:hypothetical protein